MAIRLHYPAVAVLLLPFLFGFQAQAGIGPDAPAPAALSLIPYPQQLVRRDGSFALTPETRMVCEPAAGKACRWTEAYLRTLLQRTRGVVLRRGGTGPAIVFRHDSSITQAEGYRLTVSPSGVEIAARSDAGLFYGAVTFWQLATQEAEKAERIEIPALEIADAPRFAWRGILLDSARHYQSPEFIKALLDAMARHKLNVLHWHLTDDQGWRLEIRRYPRLTSVGAWRKNKREGRYGGFYTQAQVRELVAYASRRHIAIVPEIEMPGHALAAIAAYPWLASVPHPPRTVSGDWGVFPYLYNVDDSTFAFLQNVLKEVMALFPSPYIHIGGDETPKDQWNASPHIRQQMRRLHVKDAVALQGYFTDRIGRFLKAHGRRLIGWDEILDGNPAPDAAVMSWRTVASAGEAARLGHDVVLSPAPQLYFDYCQAVREGGPTCRGPEEILKDVYGFDPQQRGALKQHLLGVQANIWTEHLPTDAAVSYAAFPRVAALAELAWTPEAGRDWHGFLARLPAQLDRYKALGLVASDAAFAADITARPEAAGAEVSLSNQADFGDLRYTLDGSPPTFTSSVYAAPFVASLPVSVTAVTFDGSRMIGEPTVAHLDTRSILKRNSYTMDQCTNDLPLAQRGDADHVVMVNVMNPCWIYRGLDLTQVNGIEAAVVELPFNFQIGQDIKRIPLYPGAAREGQLEIHLDGCKGEVLSVLPLAEAAKHKGFTQLRAGFAPRPGVHDLCFLFARRSVDPVWALDWVQPLVKE